MTEFYVSVAKVEGSGDCDVKTIRDKIGKAVQYLHGYSVKVLAVNENTLKITHREAEA